MNMYLKNPAALMSALIHLHEEKKHAPINCYACLGFPWGW